MAVKIVPVNEIDEYHKALFYGHYGSGKTQLASGFPSPVWADFERSTETLRNIGLGNIPATRIKNMKEADEFFTEVTKDSSSYETIVVDTANAMQNMQMQEYLIEQMKGSSSSKRDRDIPFMMDYRKSTNLLARYFDMLATCNKHVVIICQESQIKDVPDVQGKPAKTIAIRPLLTFKLGEIVGAMLNFVGYLEVKPGVGNSPSKRLLYVNPTNMIVAKNRLGIQKTTIENPTFDSVFVKKGK